MQLIHYKVSYPSTSCDTVAMYVICHLQLSQEWAKLEKPVRSPWPVGRDAHAACCLNYGEKHPQLLVTGGVDEDGISLHDAWILDVTSGRWSEVSGIKWFNYLCL